MIRPRSSRRSLLGPWVAGGAGLGLLAACAGAPGVPPAKAPAAKGGATAVKSGLVGKGGANVVSNGGSNVVSNGGSTIVSNGGAGATAGRAGLAAQLRDLAAIGHTRAVAGILANSGSPLVSSNAASLLANNAAGIVSNNAGGMLGNNAAGAVGAGTGASYRLAELTAPAFSLVPTGTEVAPEELPRPDGTTAVWFDRPDGTQRFVVVNAARRPLEQGLVTPLETAADGTVRASRTERSLVYGDDQRRRGFLAYEERFDEAGRLAGLTHAPSDLEGAGGALKIAVKALAFTVEPPSGAFEVRFEHLGAVEKGTITQVVRNVDGVGVGVDLSDPLATLGGESRFETADGALIFARRTTLGAAEHRLVLTLRDGFALDLARPSRTAPYTGTLSLDGTRIGTATLAVRPDASVAYAVAFDDGADPLEVALP